MIQAYRVRTVLIFFIFCAIYGIILCNLLLVQIKQRTYFTHLGQQQHELVITTPPPRATILDRTGKRLLALNKDSIAAFLLPRQLEQPQKVRAFLTQHFPSALSRLEQHASSCFLFIKRRLSPQEIDLIQKSGLHDIKLLAEPSRFYPNEATACLIGVTDIDNAGLFGIELACNDQLAGKATTYCLERDSHNTYLKKEIKVPGIPGQSVTLTIDSDLQFLAYEELKKTITHFNAKQGGAIIIDPESGDVLAMVNYPSFDPNNITNLDIEKTKNTCVSDCYELGSVIKVCAAMAALEHGVVTPDELIDCKGIKTAYIDGRKINTWKAHDIIPFEQVIAQSNNIGIAQVAQRIGAPLYDYYMRLGFGNKTGLGLPGEQKGFVNTPDNWSKQSVISLSYGYEISATLLQLARAFSLIANGGYLVQPRIVASAANGLDKVTINGRTWVDDSNSLSLKGQPQFSQSTITTIQSILEKTTLEGIVKKAAVQGYRVMSKTGTANLLENNQYNLDRNLYTCAGIVQKDNYKRVLVVFVKEAAQKDLYASTVAAPLFERIAEKTIIHEKIL